MAKRRRSKPSRIAPPRGPVLARHRYAPNETRAPDATGPGRWHTVLGPQGLRRIFLDSVDNDPKSAVMHRVPRSAVGASLFTVPAGDVEAAVLPRLQHLLTTPEMMARDDGPR